MTKLIATLTGLAIMLASNGKTLIPEFPGSAQIDSISSELVSSRLRMIAHDLESSISSRGGAEALLSDSDSDCATPMTCLMGLDESRQGLLAQRYFSRDSVAKSTLNPNQFLEVVYLEPFRTGWLVAEQHPKSKPLVIANIEIRSKQNFSLVQKIKWIIR